MEFSSDLALPHAAFLGEVSEFRIPGKDAGMDAPRSIVIVRLSAIGDVIHAVPAAVALKKAFPHARIGWAVEGRAADVLAGHPAVDHLFRLPRGWLKSPRAVLSLRRQLRAFDADVAIDMQGLLKSAVATWLSGAAIRIGHARPASRELAWCAYTHAVTASAAHIVERHCELLAPLGVTPQTVEFDMPRWPVSRSRVRDWLASSRLAGPFAIVNPGAGWNSKLWPTERFAKVARALHDRHGMRSVVAWAGPQELAAAERIVAEAGGCAVLAAPTTLHDLGELCRAARLFISSDTGPLHLAAAVGTPCVGLFGPVPARRNGPYGPQHAAVEPPLTMRPAWSERKTDQHAMAGIDVENVIAAVDRQLSRVVAA
jgi:lipopolysaccharide heptosyltransferase I